MKGPLFITIIIDKSPNNLNSLFTAAEGERH